MGICAWPIFGGGFCSCLSQVRGSKCIKSSGQKQAYLWSLLVGLAAQFVSRNPAVSVLSSVGCRRQRSFERISGIGAF
mgnify:CR=1 FL=1